MQNDVKLVGKYLGCSAIREVGTNGTKVRDFWVNISDNPEYPNTPELNLSGDKCALVDGIQKGTEVEVFARLQGNKFRDKDGKERVFTNIRVWKINIVQRQSTSANQVAAPIATGGHVVPPVTNPVAPTAIDKALANGSDDDLPF